MYNLCTCGGRGGWLIFNCICIYTDSPSKHTSQPPSIQNCVHCHCRQCTYLLLWELVYLVYTLRFTFADQASKHTTTTTTCPSTHTKLIVHNSYAIYALLYSFCPLSVMNKCWPSRKLANLSVEVIHYMYFYVYFRTDWFTHRFVPLPFTH